MHCYVHVPFCARRCSYCDFSIAVRREIPVREYVDGIAAELRVRAPARETLHTLYLGGGTPSKLGADGVARVLDVIGAHFDLASDAELTVEANPEDITPGIVGAWRAVGVNRLSLGVQSFDDGVLAWMHRTHTAADAARAVALARDEGLGNISVDLIFALPEALRRDWARDLDAALALAPTHVSAYGLTVEPATPLGRWAARGDATEAPEDTWAAEFERAHATLVSHGFSHYEVSNYAGDAGHARSRHNEAYWTEHAYIGVGPAAHGFDGDSRRWNEPAYAAWLARISRGEDPVAGTERLTPEQREAERVYLGLRTSRGLKVLPGDEGEVDRWTKAGWAQVVPRHGSSSVVLTPQGWMRLDALATALTILRSR